MTRIDLTALRTLAEDASPGPWAIEPHPYGNSPARSIHVADRDPDEFPVVAQLGCGCCDVGLDADAEDLSYIAALNPATVLRLLDALEAVLDKERKPDPDTWDLWDWGYDLALDDVADLIRAALIGDDKMTDPDHYLTGPDIIRQARAEAWDEGHAAGCADPYAKYGECGCGPNPYRERGES